MFTGSVGSCAVVPYLVNWFIFISFYFGVMLYYIMYIIMLLGIILQVVYDPIFFGDHPAGCL